MNTQSSQRVRSVVRRGARWSFLCLLFALFASSSSFTATADEVHEAAKRGDVARLEQLLSTNSTLLVRMDANGNTPLHLAAAYGRTAVIESLLAHGASVAATNAHEGLTPLHSAARRGRLGAVKLLLKHGADINARDFHGCRPLHSAVYGGHVRVARFLLDRGAAVDATRSDGTTPLFYAAYEGNTNLVALLLKHGAQPASPTAVSPLHAAARHGRVAVVGLLVAAGAGVNAPDDTGQTPLHVAAKAGQFRTVEWLLAHGADPDARDRLRFKPLDYVTGATNDALAALLQTHMKSRLEQGLPVKVGEAGDPDRLQFSGLHTFTAGQIRRALALKPSYLLAAHPQANMATYLKTLKSMLESGYQAAGFPDVEADVRYDERAGTVRVRIAEGPRFLAAGVRVSGASPALEASLIDWFTTPANTPELSQPITTASTQTELNTADSDVTLDLRATADVSLKHRPGGLNTPGKASRPDEPMWWPGEPANFSGTFATQAVLQVEACLAESGFFFPKTKVEIQRNTGSGTADLLITLLNQGPPGMIGEITVTGTQRNSPSDVIQFLDLHEGTKITAERLAEARQQLSDCGRFRYFEIAPEYHSVGPPTRRRVDLRIALDEQEGVPPLGEPLSPVQEALLRLCRWMEDFPSRDEDVEVAITNHPGFPFAFEFVIAPRHGLLLNAASLQGALPLSVGFLLGEDTIQLCSWDSGRRLAAPLAGRGELFVHLLANPSGDSNRFNLSLGGGYRKLSEEKQSRLKNPLRIDVQLSRAAFLDLAEDEGTSCSITDGRLTLTNKAYVLRADAATGRLDEFSYVATNDLILPIRFGVHVWGPASREFLRRSSTLTNQYTPGRGFSSLFAFVVTEVARYDLVRGAVERANSQQRLEAAVAMNKLLNVDLLRSLDSALGQDETNRFFVPTDAVEAAMIHNNLLTMFSGWAFQLSGELFPKYSWPWTAARETAFILMSQGRYTGEELDRLCQSEDTGPIGCLVLARLLSAADSPAARTFALRGIMRLGAGDFLRDCNLFLRGDSGLARSFAQAASALRNLPEDELAALVAVLPEAEGELLRDSAAALRAQPETPPAVSLQPALRTYWEKSLRTKVREALQRLTRSPKDEGKGSAENASSASCAPIG